MRKLDAVIRERWLFSIKKDEIPSYVELLSIKEFYASTLGEPATKTDSISTNSKFQNTSLNNQKSKIKNKKTTEVRCFGGTKASSNSPSNKIQLSPDNRCHLCKNMQYIIKCPTFLNLPPRDRYEQIKKLNNCVI